MIYVIIRIILFSYIFTGAFYAGRNIHGPLEDISDSELFGKLFKIVFGWPYLIYWKRSINK